MQSLRLHPALIFPARISLCKIYRNVTDKCFVAPSLFTFVIKRPLTFGDNSAVKEVDDAVGERGIVARVGDHDDCGSGTVQLG